MSESHATINVLLLRKAADWRGRCIKRCGGGFIWGSFSMSYKHINVPESGDMIVVNDDNSITV
ncbi:MAG: hypothetical protein ACO2ZE_13060, partial [Pseudohongiellaceae bacterium]